MTFNKGSGYGLYRTFYPKLTLNNHIFYVEYRQISRTYDLYCNDKLVGKFRHSDFIFHRIIEIVAGYCGDEIPEKHQPLLKLIEQKILLTYQGLAE